MDFYDSLAPHYHLLFNDWRRSVDRQAGQLAVLIREPWPCARRVLDVSCGIGTQSIGLAKQGFDVPASDISAGAVSRAIKEAKFSGAKIHFSVADMRNAHAAHGDGFDVVVSCDNSIPHLLSDDEILLAFRQMYACLGEGGGCVITVRDYEKESREKDLKRQYATQVIHGKRYTPSQIWDFDGDLYNVTLQIAEEDMSSGATRTHTFQSRYYAVTIGKLCDHMRMAGFSAVDRIDGSFYQPVIIGTRKS